MNQVDLEKFNANIIKWYSFKNTNSIMQIGNNYNITNELNKIFKRVVTIENSDLIDNIKEKFNYILIYGYENCNEIIEKVIKFLNEDGKLLIVGNNETGLRNWSKYCLSDTKGIQRLENHQQQFKSIIQINKEIKKCNLNSNIFYVFPNYTETDIIINEKFKIEIEHIEKYSPDIKEDEIKIFDEIKILKTIISQDSKLLDFFANSYFIEVSKEQIDTDIRYVSFNNCRKEQYQLITKIRDDVVEKIPANEKASKHVENMSKIIEKLQGNNIEILDYVKEGKLYSKLVKSEQTLDRILADNYQNIDIVIQILDNLKEMLLINSVNYYECKEKININEKEENLENLNFLEKCYWDMIPKNCFYIDGKLVFFDQEWEKDYLPVEFIIYRAIINSYDLVRMINVDDLLERLNILQYKEIFENIDNQLRQEIIDEDNYKIIYEKNNLKSIDNFINENKIFVNANEMLTNENNKKDEYIKKLEIYIEQLKDDNGKKQEYIETLENSLKSNKKRKK